MDSTTYPIFFTFSHDIWKCRCETLAATTDSTYEAQIWKERTSLLIQLSSKPHSLPVSYRYLTNKPHHFTAKATTRALQSWLQRIRIGLQKARDGNLRSTSDICNWFRPSKPIPDEVSHDEQEINFESTLSNIEPNPETPESPTILTVPYLPYVPFQNTPTYPKSTLNPILFPTYAQYRNI